MMRFLTILVVFRIFAALSQTIGDIEKKLSQPDFSSSVIGISVKEVSSKKVLFEKNSHLHLVPASILKLFVTYTAIEKLGSNYRFKTEIYYSGSIKNDTLKGNLVIKGYGDPTIQSRFFSSNQVLQDIIQSLKEKRISYIDGKIIILNNYFQPKVNGNWVYEDVNNYYAAIPYPVNIYDNQYHLYFRSDAANQYASVLKIEPQYYFQPKIMVLSNEVIAKEGGDNAFIYGDPLGYEKRIEGSIPPFQKEYSIEGVLPDPARMFAESLASAMNAEGIHVEPTKYMVYNDTITLPKMMLLTTSYSPPLSEIVKVTNLFSINLFAEAMVYAIGNGDYNQGKKVVYNTLIKIGIHPSEINIDDGCGLSRNNGVSANAMTDLLITMYNSANKEVYLNSLPVAGKTGTMKNFSDTYPLKDNLRCKTGYFKRTRTYAGYMNTKTGKTLSICIMFNNASISSEQIKQFTKDFFQTMYNHF
ncbi:MAG: D-alanyl-D-alanine carboxypeptidase/D-alanyl-D-alanine-endopeptidase [Bacteroidia bacterium]|nr:D-alanyl-D-alanine carboxypeptidase/D-alanyl-D-alanine-endopeptidase [Bacteroidia bacterium]